jgi:hypothetical protein
MQAAGDTLGYRELMDVAAGFAAFLAIILIYVFMMDARGRKLRKELERVRKMVGGGDKGV